MSVHCPDCGASASYGREIGHKSDCPSLTQPRKPRPMTPYGLAETFSPLPEDEASALREVLGHDDLDEQSGRDCGKPSEK